MHNDLLAVLAVRIQIIDPHLNSRLKLKSSNEFSEAARDKGGILVEAESTGLLTNTFSE